MVRLAFIRQRHRRIDLNPLGPRLQRCTGQDEL